MKFLSLQIPLQILFAVLNGDLVALALKFTRKCKLFYTSTSGIFVLFQSKLEQSIKLYLKFLYNIFYENPCSLSRVDLCP
jgi:hypothetical protein